MSVSAIQFLFWAAAAAYRELQVSTVKGLPPVQSVLHLLIIRFYPLIDSGVHGDAVYVDGIHWGESTPCLKRKEAERNQLTVIGSYQLILAVVRLAA